MSTHNTVQCRIKNIEDLLRMNIIKSPEDLSALCYDGAAGSLPVVLVA
ncbi:MAG: hypothetical protein ACLTLQ_05785 [[Clostridium] scindens]